MKIIPAIDLIEGKCVRLTQGDYNQKKIYNEDPIEVAKTFEDNGIRYLHLVDLDGAKVGKIINQDILYKIATHTNLIIDFGGGLKTEEDLNIAFENGATQVTGGSIAVQQPEVFSGWLEKYGPEKIILGADCKNQKIAVNGWQETTELDVFSYIQAYEKKGIQNVICTDISVDGMLSGPAINLYKNILSETKINLIASGGVSQLSDIFELEKIGCFGVIIGKAIYENKISLNELSKICSKNV